MALAADLIVGGTAVALARRGFRIDVSPLGVAVLRDGDRLDLETVMQCREASRSEQWRRLV